MYLSLDVQWFVIEMQHLLHKGHIDKWGNIKLRLHDPKVMSWPWNSSSKKIWIKSFKWIDFSQVAAKISKVKVGGWKKMPTWPNYIDTDTPKAVWTGIFYFHLQLWPLMFLEPLCFAINYQYFCLNPSMKFHNYYLAILLACKDGTKAGGIFISLFTGIFIINNSVSIIDLKIVKAFFGRWS